MREYVAFTFLVCMYVVCGGYVYLLVYMSECLHVSAEARCWVSFLY